MYNKEFYGDRFNQDHFYNKTLHFQIIENGTALPPKNPNIDGKFNWGFGGIVDAQGKYIASSYITSGSFAYTPTEEVINSDETVIYFSMLFNVWGHLISDCIKRAWFFKSKAYKRYFQNCKIIYTITGGVL